MRGEELKVWRVGAGLTQAGAASRMGLGERAYQNLEADPASFRTLHGLAADMASMNLALERRDASVLTDTALRVFVSLEPLVTPHIRARLDFADVLVLTDRERALVDSWVAATGQQPTREQTLAFIRNVRADEADRSGGQVRLEGTKLIPGREATVKYVLERMAAEGRPNQVRMSEVTWERLLADALSNSRDVSGGQLREADGVKTLGGVPVVLAGDGDEIVIHYATP